MIEISILSDVSFIYDMLKINKLKKNSFLPYLYIFGGY